ncbi:PLC-like phosphodiesterase [Meredithblackwellia eburnea MCA 4105]
MADQLASRLESQHIDDPQDQDQEDNEDEQHHSDDDDSDDQAKAKRTYHIVLHNTTGLPIQVSAWPVRASTHSDYLLRTYKGADFHDSVLPNGTVSTDEHFTIGQMRGPKHLDPRKRWGWVFVDLVHPDGTKVHLQLYIKLDRKGLHEATIGHTDLDSNVKNPQSSGQVGSKGKQDDGNKIVFEIDESLKTLQNAVDDSVKHGIKTVPGKGIETHSYVSHKLARASLLIGSEARYHEFAAPVLPDRLSKVRHTVHEIEGVSSRYIGAFVENDGKAWFEGHVKVHPVTGIAKGSGFDSTAETVAVFGNGAVINYGFHDAGEGRHDMVYVYATPEYSNWLGDLITSNPAWKDMPFSKLCLAAAHDAGMFGKLDAGLDLLIKQGKLGNALASHAESNIATPVVHFLVAMLEDVKLRPERVINNIALTQKDTFADQLKIGVRFFDFRPGFCFHDVIYLKKGVIHHQHAMVPGCTYLQFLTDIFNFLGDHTSEIVVVELKSDGFVVREDKVRNGEVVVYSMIPNEEELAGVMEEARQATSDGGRAVVIASAQDLDRPIGELIESNKRLIIIDRVHHPDDWDRGDSYDHVSYNTTNPATILASLEKTYSECSHPQDPAPGKPSKGTIYQLQATPTANIKMDVAASITYSDCSSLLTFMKPQMDRTTYPWIAGKTFDDPGNVILLNDFVDGVLVEHALDVSRRRAGL